MLAAVWVPQAADSAVAIRLSPPSTVFPSSAEMIELAGWERSVASKVAEPAAVPTRFGEPHPRPTEGTPTRALDTWLMLLVSALLIMHQLRRKQRSLNQRLTH